MSAVLFLIAALNVGLAAINFHYAGMARPINRPQRLKHVALGWAALVVAAVAAALAAFV